MMQRPIGRRQLLQAALAAGLGSAVAHRLTRNATAAPKGYRGPVWLFVHASGGWDPTLFCDPKGGDPNDPAAVNRSYTPNQIRTVGAFRVAPTRLTLQADATQVEVYSAERFFQDHGARTLVLNGVDTETNSHDSGTRAIWSGRGEEGHPALAALIAGAANRELSDPLPMPFLSYGGYDAVFDAVPLARAGGYEELRRLAYPDRIDASEADSETFHSKTTQTRIHAAQQARLASLGTLGLPESTRAQAQLKLAQASDSGLRGLADALGDLEPVSLEQDAELAPVAQQLRGLEGMMREAQFALAAFQANACVSATLSVGGFDTHSNHDEGHSRSLMQLLRGIDYIVDEAKRRGLSNRLNIVIGSDFGRTPFYNDGNGKDHWNVTSMLLMGPQIEGGRVIGATDADFAPRTVDPKSLKTLNRAVQGTRLRPANIHMALRALAKLNNDEVTARYALAGDALPLFG